MAARILRAISALKKGTGFPSRSWRQTAIASPDHPVLPCSRMHGRLVHTGSSYSREELDRQFMMMHLRISQQDYQKELMQERFTNLQHSVRNDIAKSHADMFRRNVAFYMAVAGLLFTAYPYFESKKAEPVTGPCVYQNDSSVDQKKVSNQVPEPPTPSPIVSKMTKEAATSVAASK